MPPPTPPSVNDGRMIEGNPRRSTTLRASSTDFAYALFGTSMSIDFIASRNFRRSSATMMASIEAPISETPNSSSTPWLSSSTARFSAVWPPTVGNNASGRSRSITERTTSQVSGSTYVRSATSGSVMMVAGFELTSTTSSPSARNALHAWVPE